MTSCPPIRGAGVGQRVNLTGFLDSLYIISYDFPIYFKIATDMEIIVWMNLSFLVTTTWYKKAHLIWSNNSQMLISEIFEILIVLTYM